MMRATGGLAWSLALIASTAALAQSAAPVPPTAPATGAPMQAAPTQAGSGGQVGATRAPDSYVLAPGDHIRITVFGEDRLSGEYVVNSIGELSFPLIGNQKVTGMTAADVQSMLATKLSAGYLKDPRITADILVFRPYYVLGEVARPGSYPYVDGLTIQQAIASAGGYTYRAKRTKVFLRGPNQTGEKEVDLKKSPLAPIAPGDTVRIGERFF